MLLILIFPLIALGSLILGDWRFAVLEGSALAGLVVKSNEEGNSQILREVATWLGAYRSRAEQFFSAQIDIDPARPSQVRTAEIVARVASSEQIVPGPHCGTDTGWAR